MEPQSPPAPASASLVHSRHSHHSHHSRHSHHSHRSHRSSHRTLDGHEYLYSEKDAYERPLRSPAVQRGSKGSSKSRAHDSVISSHPLSPHAASPPSPTSSLSSVPRHLPAADVHQPRSVASVPAYPPRAYLDPEKAGASPHRPSSPARGSGSNPAITAVLYDSGEYHEKGPEDKPVQLLLFLSGPCVLLSLLITFWSIVAILVALVLAPLRLFSSRPTLSTQLTTFLAPALNLQLHLIYSYSESTNYSPAMLVVVHLFSVFVALGVAIASWTAAFFWFFSLILGDPAGQDNHNDGKDSILGVRNWWDRWLSRALR